MAARAEPPNPAPWRRGGVPAPQSAVKMASQDRGPGGAERADGVAAQEGGAAGAAMLGAAAGAAAPNPATESWGDDRAPESASDLASRGGVPGGAERVDGVAAQEGGAVGAATLGAAAGAVAPDPTAEPRGDDPARRSSNVRWNQMKEKTISPDKPGSVGKIRGILNPTP